MNRSSYGPPSDVLAVGLSTVCLFHCLVLPIAITLLPFLSGSFLASEHFHVWMVVTVVPVSFFALTLGCKQHKSAIVLTLGTLGITLLITALFINENTLGGYGEKLLTTIASIMIATGHILNFKLCRHSKTET